MAAREIPENPNAPREPGHEDPGPGDQAALVKLSNHPPVPCEGARAEAGAGSDFNAHTSADFGAVSFEEVESEYQRIRQEAWGRIIAEHPTEVAALISTTIRTANKKRIDAVFESRG